MHEPDAISEHRKRRAKLAMATLAGATVVALALPSVAGADPEPSPSPAPPPPSGNTFLQGPPADPNAPPPPADAGAPAPAPAAADPNAPAPPPAPEPGRVNNAAGGFSYVVPAGWKVADATQLSYGQALLTKAEPEGTPQTQPGQQAGQAAQPANDTSVLLGRLDMKLFAGAEADNAKAATRLASDMGEFFMPFPGTRINQENGQVSAGDMPGAFSAYDVKFTDTNKPNGQIWAGVVGNATPTVGTGPLAPRGQRNERWFVVWLGSANHPVDKAAAAALTSSIRPWSPPAPPPPDPNAPAPAEPNGAPADPNAPPAPNNAPGRPPIGVGVPVDPANAPGMMPAG